MKIHSGLLAVFFVQLVALHDGQALAGTRVQCAATIQNQLSEQALARLKREGLGYSPLSDGTEVSFVASVGARKPVPLTAEIAKEARDLGFLETYRRTRFSRSGDVYLVSQYYSSGWSYSLVLANSACRVLNTVELASE